MDQDYKIETCRHEMDYRKELFNGDWGRILDLEIKCSVCGNDIHWMVLFKKQIMKHPVLEILLCEACLEPHKSTDWTEGCLWCGLRKPKEIIQCCYCPNQFCESCIKLNYGAKGITKARLSDWKCYICKKERLYSLRAICDAADKFTEELRKMDTKIKPIQINKCSYCKNDFKTIKQLQCGHKFHNDCFKNWTSKCKNCPLCRANVPV